MADTGASEDALDRMVDFFDDLCRRLPNVNASKSILIMFYYRLCNIEIVWHHQ